MAILILAVVLGYLAHDVLVFLVRMAGVAIFAVYAVCDVIWTDISVALILRKERLAREQVPG